MLTVLAAVGALAAPARAAPNHIAAALLAEGPVAPGQTVTLAITMQPEKGWHGYWKNPGDAGFGMTLNWALPAGSRAGKPAYPVPHTLLIAGLMNHVYEDAYALLVPLTVPASARPGTELAIRAKADWLACTDQICVPERAELATTVRIAAPGTATLPDPRFDAWRAQLPAPLGSTATFEHSANRIRIGIPLPRSVALDSPHFFPDADRVVAYAATQEYRRKDDILIVTVDQPARNALRPTAISGVLSLDRNGTGVVVSALPGPVPAGGEPLTVDAPALTSLPLLLLAALAGGLLLNVMPCVFPILSLKALSLARAGESKAQARAEGIAYTAGVVLACTGLGGLLLMLRAAGTEIGWAFQLQEPGVVAALLLVAVAITANLAGLYEFAVPGFARAGSRQGAFATGLLAAFVATPCTGPFMAAAMGAALLLPPLPAMALFAALGFGLALPFLAIAFVPRLRAALPRPGLWMVRFRQILAVPMALTAAALAWVAWRLAGSLFAGSVLALAIALLLVLGITGRIQRRGGSARHLAAGGIGALALAVVVLLPGTVRQTSGDTASILPSRAFSNTALEAARASGKPVFAYFTADWCLTCKVNEQVAIEREETRKAFTRADVQVLRGDWTRRDSEITRYLTAHGAAGVPLYVWYRPGKAPEILPQVLTPAMLAALAGERP